MIGNYRIGITGTHNAGKSTLVDALSKELEGYPLITEVAASYCREERQHLATQFKIMLAQMREETKHVYFISDRTVIDNLAYSTLNFEESVSKELDLDVVINKMKMFSACLDLERTYITTRPYDLMVFVDEMFPIDENDEKRCPNEKYQWWIHHFLKGEIGVTSALYRIPVIEVSGPTEKRVELIMKKLEGFGARNPVQC